MFYVDSYFFLHQVHEMLYDFCKYIHVVTLHGDEMMALRDSGNCSATISLMYSMTNDRYD
jgi:hypothetical protein